MRLTYQRIDTRAATLARDARETAKQRNKEARQPSASGTRGSTPKTSPLAVFKAMRAKATPPLFLKSLRDLARFDLRAAQSAWDLRLDLEEALMRLDECAEIPSRLEGHPRWPSDDDLKRIDEIATKLARLISKHPPTRGWKRCERIDRSFPKLKLCFRIGRFIKAMLGHTQRPLGLLMPAPSEKMSDLARGFFNSILSTRRQQLHPAKINWLKYEELLATYQHSLSPKRAWRLTPLEKELRGDTINARLLAYISFLELECADLRWTHTHYKHYWTVGLWLNGLGDAKLLEGFSRFIVGPIDFVESSTALSAELSIEEKRRAAKERKARSRRNSSAKSVTSSGPSPSAGSGTMREKAQKS